MIRKGYLAFVFVAAFLIGTSSVLAQQGLPNPLVLSITPTNPKPEESVTVEVKTISWDLTRSDIGWLENGEFRESGVGLTKHTFTAGKTGEETQITVIVKNPGGLILEKTIIVRPGSVDIVWETQGLTHPFYKGKSLYTYLGVIRFTAFPEIVDANGILIPASDIYYTWKKNNEVLGSKSGYGKSSLLIDEIILQTPFTIEVLAESRDQAYAASGKVSVGVTEPSILLYEDNPLYGILFNKALTGNFSLLSKELTIEAFPFYFNVNKRSDLTYTWRIGGRQASGFDGPYLTVRDAGNGTGSAGIRLDVSNPESLVEGASGSFTVKFGNE